MIGTKIMLAASVERDSKHPLAEAVRQKSERTGLTPQAVPQFEAIPDGYSNRPG